MGAEDFVRAVPDCPEKGETYYDFSRLLTDREGFDTAMAGLMEMFDREVFDAVLCTSSYGGMLGAAMAQKLGRTIIPVRDEGSVPGPCETFPVEGKDRGVQVPEGSIRKGMKLILMADVLATGRTTKAIIGLAERSGAEVIRIGYIAELSEYGARKSKSLRGYPFESLTIY